MFDFNNINEYTEDPGKEYSEGVKNAKTKEDLLKHIEAFGDFGYRASWIVRCFTEEEFRKFKEIDFKNSKLETFFERICAEIVCPSYMVKISAISNKFGVPWGTAYWQYQRTLEVKTPPWER